MLSLYISFAILKLCEEYFLSRLDSQNSQKKQLPDPNQSALSDCTEE